MIRNENVHSVLNILYLNILNKQIQGYLFTLFYVKQYCRDSLLTLLIICTKFNNYNSQQEFIHQIIFLVFTAVDCYQNQQQYRLWDLTQCCYFTFNLINKLQNFIKFITKFRNINSGLLKQQNQEFIFFFQYFQVQYKCAKFWVTFQSQAWFCYVLEFFVKIFIYYLQWKGLQRWLGMWSCQEVVGYVCIDV
eukprot:TRINITY_DN3575_c0_g1_i5.p1 TRINITY_DN3575_c0_g1~~TRINITY_DN3575_c0_g1_i5.p1  ORF type:complete len:192 (+),score=-15.24 TRINITY_DN3575_c0_g1_i5:263-838(+)